MPEVDATTVAGVDQRGYRRGALTTDGWDPYVIPTTDRIESFGGRAATFITPGRAAVTQNILAIFNGAGSSVIVAVERAKVDMVQTAAAVAIGVVPPIIQLVRLSAAPTNGTTLTKGTQDTALTSNASVTVTGDASAHGTLSGTTLTMTAGQVMSQTWAPRLVQGTATAANSVVAELIDTAQFLYGEPDITLRAGEGLGITLTQATVTTGNPSTHRWIATLDWTEFTRP